VAVGYGNETASDANVVFAYDLALDAARDLYALAGQVREHQSQRAGLKPAAEHDWQGPKHDDFVTRMAHEGTDATNVADGLVDMANELAGNWAKARGQQDRINFARYVDHETSSDGFLENVGEFFTGEDDYGSPPENPPVPSPPQFAVTRAPQHAEYEHV
jgi:hypothetical protein